MRPAIPHSPHQPSSSTQKNIMYKKQTSPLWMKQTLQAAAVYNMLWGIWVVFFPYAFFDGAGLPRTNTPQIWQSVGMIVGVYGIGYALAAGDILRHWVIVMVGFLGKLFGVLGVGYYVAFGGLSPAYFWITFTNDLIWLVPFAMMLWWVFSESQNTENQTEPLPFDAALHEFRVQTGQTLYRLSMESPVMLVFLRHFGCTFCREALAELARKRNQKKLDPNTRLVLVHMATDEEAARFFARYGLENEARISDRNCELYRAFSLGRGTFGQLFGLRSWLRGAWLLLTKGIFFGAPIGDGFRMPGVFLVYRGRIIKSFRHAFAAQVPDYDYISACRVSETLPNP